MVIEYLRADVSIDASVKTTELGGTIMQIGIGKNYTNFPIAEVNGKKMKLIECFRCSFGIYRDFVSLAATCKVNIESLIIYAFKFEDTMKACWFVLPLVKNL